MWPFGVVEADPLVDEEPGLEAVGKVVQIHRAPQPLDEDVVHATAPAVHRDSDTGRPQAPGEGEAGELAALIGIENLRLAMASQRLIERLDAKVRVQGVRQPPSQHMPTRPIHDRHQVKEASAHRDIGDVGAPDLIGPVDRHALEQIRVDPVPLLESSPASGRNDGTG